jgi:hypothetical protein
MTGADGGESIEHRTVTIPDRPDAGRAASRLSCFFTSSCVSPPETMRCPDKVPRKRESKNHRIFIDLGSAILLHFEPISLTPSLSE